MTVKIIRIEWLNSVTKIGRQWMPACFESDLVNCPALMRSVFQSVLLPLVISLSWIAATSVTMTSRT